MGEVQVPDAPAAEKVTEVVGAAPTVMVQDEGAAPQAETDVVPAAPRMGQVVEYCLNAGIYPGKWRPALVIKSAGADCAQLAVLTDFANDGLPCPLWAPAATRGDGPGQWRTMSL